MSTIMISDIMERHIKSICSEYGTYIVNKLSAKYGFDAEEASRELEMPAIKRTEAAAPRRKDVTEKKPKAAKAEKAPVPSIPLPFCGVVVEGWCGAIIKNSKLYTQCTNMPANDGLCKKCSKIVEKDGELPFGLISSRAECDSMSFKDPKGNAPVLYSAVMTKLKITREDAEAEATKFGLTIPEEQFAVVEKSRGRPKKTAVENSDDEDSSDKKARGRPKKEKPVKASSKVGDDVIKGLLQEAKANGQLDDETLTSNSQSSSDAEDLTQAKDATEKVMKELADKKKMAKKPKQTEEEKAAVKAAKEAEKAAAKEAEKAAKQAAKEAEKAAKDAAKAEKEAEKAAKDAAKAEKATKKPAAKAAAKVEESKSVDTSSDDEVQAEEYSSSSSEEEEKPVAAVTPKKAHVSGGVAESKGEVSEEEEESEEEQAVTVKKFEHEGKKYKLSTDNILYDWETDDPVGLWNPKTKKIEELPEESSDEEDDE